jgi:hypothetical protein
MASQAVVPVLSDFAIGYLAAREGCKRLLPEMDLNKPWTTGVETPPYDDTTVSYVADGYKISVRELSELCALLRARRSFPWICDVSALQAMVYHDDL